MKKLTITLLILALVLATVFAISGCHEHDYIESVVPATCTEDGYTRHTCACGDNYDDNIVTATGHTAGAAATCTTAQTCTVCDAVIVEATGHSPADTFSSDAENHWYACANCDEKVSSAAHTFGDWTETLAATCTVDGSHKRTCSVCNYEQVEAITAAGHVFGEVIVDTPATEDVVGAGHKECANCDETEVVEIPMIVYVWKTVSTEANVPAFVFNTETEELEAINTVGLSDLWLNMYAINYTGIDAMQNYMVEATITPTGENNTQGAERTYGIVAWYQDADNYLIYWLQNKGGNDWSGQFYGKVNGQNRNFLDNSTSADAWKTNEWNDMWWDGGTAHPSLRNVRGVLLTETVTIRIVSTIETIQIAGVDTQVRAFELHQIVDGTDHVASTYYVKDVIEQGRFRTGVYANNIDIAVSDYNVTTDLWTVVSTEDNAACAVFDEETGDLEGIYSVGATDLWLNMYALSNINEMGNYSVEATFTPAGEGNARGAERTYGIVAWYLDADNYLIYWMQQKDGGNWSGQFYGKVAGVNRNFTFNSTTEGAWNGSEWRDMWWDGGEAHPTLKLQSNILLSTEVTLKVVSTITKVTINEVEETCRAFELHQIVNGEDFVAGTYYIKGTGAETAPIYSGVYTNNFDMDIQYK